MIGPIQANGVKEFVCLGHKLTYHGDTTRNHNFWIYPEGSHPPNKDRWDFVGKHPYKVCSFHRPLGNGAYECLGHGPHGDVKKPSYHGDASRNWSFWIYPPHMDIVRGEWDFRFNPCNNSQFVQTHSNGIQEFRCGGHKHEKHKV